MCGNKFSMLFLPTHNHPEHAGAVKSISRIVAYAVPQGCDSHLQKQNPENEHNLAQNGVKISNISFFLQANVLQVVITKNPKIREKIL